MRRMGVAFRSFSSTIALATWLTARCKKSGGGIIRIVFFVPLTLAVQINKSKDFKNSLDSETIIEKIKEELRNKYEEATSEKDEGASWREVCKEEQEIMNKIMYSIEKEEVDIGRNCRVKTVLLPVPIPLTNVKMSENTKYLYTFRLSNASEIVENIVKARIIYDILDTLHHPSEKRRSPGSSTQTRPRLEVYFDTTHGVNFLSAALYSSISLIEGFLEALQQLELVDNTMLSIYNSDPVSMDIAGSSYKLHLVLRRRPGRGAGSGAWQRFLQSVIRNNLEALASPALRAQELAKLSQLLVASAAASTTLLPWALVYTHGLSEKEAYCDLKNLLVDMAEPKRLKELKLYIRKEIKKNATIYKISYEPKEVLKRLRNPLGNIAALLAAASMGLQRILRECEASITEVGYIKQGSVCEKQTRLIEVKISTESSCESTLEKLLDTPSYAVVRREMLKTEQEDATYNYLPCQNMASDKGRNLAAHAGLARGAATYLEYSDRRLRRAILASNETICRIIAYLAGITNDPSSGWQPCNHIH